MKKSKLMIALLVGSIGLLGTGYAVFKQDVVLKEQIQTGEFKLRVIPRPLDMEYSYGNEQNSSKISKPSCVVETITDNHTLNEYKFTIDNLMPGEEIRIPIDIKNIGNTAAKVKEITMETNAGNIYVKGYYCNEYGSKVELREDANGILKLRPLQEGSCLLLQDKTTQIILVIGLEAKADDSYEDMETEVQMVAHFEQYIPTPYSTPQAQMVENQN